MNNRNFFDNGNNHNYNAQTNNSDYRSINNTNNQNLTQNQQNSDPRVNSPSIFDGNNNPHLKSPGDNFSQVNHNNSPNNLANAPNGNQSYLAQQNINSPQIRGQLNQTMLPTIGNNMIISNVPDTKPLTDQNINNYSPLNYYPQPTTQFPNTNANYIPLNSMQQQSYLPSNNGFHNIGNLNASRQETRENIVDSRGTDMQMIPQQPNPFGINNGNANRVSQNGYAVNPNYFTDPSSNPFNNNLQYGANINNSRPTTQSSQHHSSNNGIQPQSFHINGNQPENLFHPQSLSVANMSYQQPVQSFVNNDKNRLNEFSIPSTNFMSNYSVPHYEHNSPISNESMPSNFNYESRNSRSSPGQMRPSNNFQFEPVDLNRYSANNTKRIPNRNDNSGNNLFKQNETGRVNPFPFSNRSKWATDEDEQLFQSSLKGNEVNRHSATTPSTMFGLRPNTSKVPLYNRKLSEKKHNVPNSKRIIRLHKTADKLCMKVLSGDENSKKAMKHLLRGIELWQDKKNVPSGKLFHSVVSMNLIDDETADLAIDCIKLCEDSVRPIEIDEIYSKMLDIFHHHSVESYKNESNNDLLSPKKHDTTVKLGVKETNLVPKKKDQFSVTCESSCQTMPEGKSFDMFQHKGPKVEMTNYLPEDFYFVHYDSSVFELLPGMYLANDNMIKSALLSSGQMESKLPSKVRYVYTSNTSNNFDTRLKEVPSYITIPKVKGFEALLFPPSLKICEGIQLISGERHLLSNFIKPFDDILLMQINKSQLNKVPTGLTIIEISDILYLSHEIKSNIPKGLEIIQMKGLVDLPEGVEISPGVMLAKTPPNLVLPQGVRLISREGPSSLSKGVNKVELETSLEDEILNAHLSFNNCCSVMSKPDGFEYDLGMEIIKRPKNIILPNGFNLVPICEYPDGLYEVLSKYDKDLELVRITPRYDFPSTARISEDWSICNRPAGLRLPVNTYLVYPIMDASKLQQIPPLPNWVSPVKLTVDIVKDYKLPNYCMAVEFLIDPLSNYCLPEGVSLGDGITVLDPNKYINHDVGLSQTRRAINALLIDRQDDVDLPLSIEKGCSNDLPKGLRMDKGMEIVRVKVRFELPAGVIVSSNCKLGKRVQITI